PTKRPEGAAAVLDALVAEPVAYAIGQARGDAPDNRVTVAALDAPARHHVPLLQLAEEARNVVRVVLQIGVHHDHPAPEGRLEPGVGGGRLPLVLLESDETDARVAIAKGPDDLGAPVAAPVVDEDHFVRERQSVEPPSQLRPEERQVLLF